MPVEARIGDSTGQDGLKFGARHLNASGVGHQLPQWGSDRTRRAIGASHYRDLDCFGEFAEGEAPVFVDIVKSLADEGANVDLNADLRGYGVLGAIRLDPGHHR